MSFRDAPSVDGPQHFRLSVLLALRWGLVAFTVAAALRFGWRAASIGLNPGRTLADLGLVKGQ